jgi:hypothetical protein
VGVFGDAVSDLDHYPDLGPSHARTEGDFLRDLWRWRAGLPPAPPPESFERFAERQWSREFETLMRNRLIMGGLRYGGLGYEGKRQFNRIKAIGDRLKNYEETGNLEWLVDCANLCLLEYVEGRHPKRHFHAHDDGEHVEEM